MKYLIDTHTLIWFVENDSKLPPATSSIISNLQNSIFVSMASLWEISIKTSIGKLKLNQPVQSIFNCLPLQSIEVLPINQDHILEILSLSFHHRDPFDRLIIAQALAEGIPVVSSDQLFDRYGVDRIW